MPSTDLNLSDFLYTVPKAGQQKVRGGTGGESCVLLSQVAADELELGVYFTEEVVKSSRNLLPLKVWDQDALPVFWVLIEEISHFHLICERAHTGGKTSLLELEWQAEVDKMLFSALYLRSQTGDCYFEALFYHLFEREYCFAADHYYIAHQLAAKFWKGCLNSSLTGLDGRASYQPALREYLRAIFPKPLPEKTFI